MTKLKKPPLSTIHDRIRYVREGLDMTQSEFARALDARPQMVNQWERGPKAPGPENLFKFHQMTRVPVGWLLFGGDLPSRRDDGKFVEQHKGRQVVYRSALQAINNIDADDNSSTTTAVYPCSDQAFALRITDQSNAPAYPPGCTVIIDPKVEPGPTDIVLAAAGKENKPVIGELRFEAHRKGLTLIVQPINAAFPAARSDAASLRIVGTMTEATIPRRHSTDD